mmetsp:Transcript_11879/g.18352  ORF Transcript_11879/g.18352 Transcript_11879/m.18352 type:complete len:92 (+) Transcript_11879:3363-3638(+)|eukprot:CAMPEP_0170498024 /NCGR_PEP_ID=MMETSP0208-20121228/26554_1 /TAXON_ID=197538 /ORGANISM="Strombidium inclinatum, Strain S3" /LENGTH=91 /DNA_ID=CAMNT_0010775055 /DNA_START=3284 /DNA_END=3559 /DNA_ORIENTATION=+
MEEEKLMEEDVSPQTPLLNSSSSERNEEPDIVIPNFQKRQSEVFSLMDFNDKVPVHNSNTPTGGFINTNRSRRYSDVYSMKQENIGESYMW